MKKLNELTINPEKVIRNEELLNLRGGYPVAWGDYKCCWDATPTVCSTCTYTNNPTCVEGAHVVKC